MQSSLRRPKRLIMRGDDEKDYKFLIKGWSSRSRSWFKPLGLSRLIFRTGGEDMRLDQRVEQIYSIMNEALRYGPRFDWSAITVYL